MNKVAGSRESTPFKAENDYAVLSHKNLVPHQIFRKTGYGSQDQSKFGFNTIYQNQALGARDF